MKTLMKIILLSLFFISSIPLLKAQEIVGNFYETNTSNLEINSPSPVKHKKKILIFTSKGGYWHMAACEALTALLSSHYDVVIVNPIEQILHSYDFVKIISGGLIDGEQLYDWLLQKNWINFSSMLYRYVVPSTILTSKEAKTALIHDYMLKEKPDLVVSVIPYLNLFISDAAHQSGVPFLLITPDSDLRIWWVLGLDEMTHDNFLVAIGVETEKTRPVLNECGIDDERIQHAGLPIRPDFLEKKDKAAIRATWNIPPDKFVIMIMMGGAGSFASYKYARKIAALNLNVHLLVCVGKNQQLMQKISKIPLNEEVSLTCIPFTNRISDLMAVSDLLITKPGPGSINEALYSELPMLVDKTDGTIYWENGNIELVKENHWGDVVPSLHQLEALIEKHMDDSYREKVKQAMRSYERKNFSENIMRMIMQLCPLGD